jgi:homoserine kinase
MTDRPILVRVPATVGNFAGSGPGAALALEASMNVKVTPRMDGQLRMRYFGENGDRVPRDNSNLIVQAMRSALSARQRRFTGASIEVYNSIPIGVGLGASAAAVWAGLIAANCLFDLHIDEQLLFALAAGLEPRKDNVHAAWLGGLVVLTGPGGTYDSVTVPEPLELGIVVPDIGEESKPLQVPCRRKPYSGGARSDSIERAAAVAKFLSEGGRIAALRIQSATPQTSRVVIPVLDEVLRVSAPGTLFICGSGPAVGVLGEPGACQGIEAVRDYLSGRGIPSRALELRSSSSGAHDWNSMYHLEPYFDAEPLRAVAAACWEGPQLRNADVASRSGRDPASCWAEPRA